MATAAGIAATASGSPRDRSTAKPSTTNNSRIEMISARIVGSTGLYGGGEVLGVGGVPVTHEVAVKR